MVDPTRQPERSFEYVDVSAVSNQTWSIGRTTRHTGRTAPSRARKLVRAGDVIVATIRPTLKRVAVVPTELDGQVVSTAFCVCRVDPAAADPRFVYYALLDDEFVAALGRVERGASYPAVSDGDVLRQEIPMPPVQEQRAIADLLGAIQSAVAVQDKMVAALKELKAGTMAKLFREGLHGSPVRETEVGNLPSPWGLRTLRELLAEAIRNGHSAPETPDPQGVRTLTLSAVTRRDFSPASTKLTSADHERVAELWLRDGDVFVERANTIEMVGLAALYRGPSDYAIFPDLLMRVRIKPDTLEPELLVEWLLLPWCRSYFSRHAGGAATNMPKIDQGTLERVPVPLPPPEERTELVSVIQTLDKSVLRAKAKRKALEDLFSSALQSLLSGDLRITTLTED